MSRSSQANQEPQAKSPQSIEKGGSYLMNKNEHYNREEPNLFQNKVIDEHSTKISEAKETSLTSAEISSSNQVDNSAKSIHNNEVKRNNLILEVNPAIGITDINFLNKKFVQSNNSIIVRKIKLNNSRLKSSDRKPPKENINLFQLLQQNESASAKKDIVMNDSQKKVQRRIYKYSTPDKLNFYSENTKRFYRNYDWKSPIKEVNPLIEESPFKAIAIPEELLTNENYIYLYSSISKAIIIVGFVGVIAVTYNSNEVQNYFVNISDFLQKNWVINVIVVITLVGLVYFYKIYHEKNQNRYDESVAKMIFESMKTVLESEKSSDVDIEITDKDILDYYSLQLHLTESYISQYILPIILTLVQQDKSLLQVIGKEGGNYRYGWKLKPSYKN